MTGTSSHDRYVPAAGRAAFTSLYDPVMATTMRERDWRPKLIAEASASSPEGGTVLDIGAGTGTFALAMKEARPDIRMIAVDGDDEALRIARSKSGATGVEWTEGLAGELPIEDGIADVVTISLLLHHLEPDAKHEALSESRRVLRPGGRLLIADWGKPRDPVIGAGFLLLRVLDGFSNTRDHAEGHIPEMAETAGFIDLSVWERLRTPWGSLELIRATAP